MTTRTVTVKLRGEVSAYLANQRRAKEATKETREEVQRLETAASALTRAGLISAIAGLPGALAPAGAAVAALPGLALSAGASFGVMALAVNGVGDAMKAVAEGDAEKLNEALAELSVEARDFIGEYQRVKPLLDEVGDATQDSFFRQLRGDLELLAERYLPTMLNQMPQLAAALGKATSETAKWAAAPGTVAAVNRQFELATDLTEDFGRILRAGIGLMLDLSDASAQFNKGFVGGLADGVEGMRRWVASARATGQMNQMFDNGARILSKLGDIAAQTGDLLFDMAANPALTDATMALLDILGMTLEIVHGLVNAFGALPGPLQSTVATLLAVGGAALLLAGRVAAMKAALMTASMNLQSLGPAGERAARGLEKATKWAGRAAVALVALQVGTMLLDEFSDASADVNKLTKSLERFANTGEQSGEMTRLFGKDMEQLSGELYDVDGWFHKVGKTAEDWIIGLRPISEALFDFSFTQSIDDVRAFDQALTQMVENGQLRQADIVFTRALQSSGKSLEEVQKLLPGYTAAMADAEAQLDDTARAHSRAAAETKLLSESLGDAVRSGKTLAQVFDELNGAAVEWAEAESELEQAIDNATESIVKHKDGLNASTQVGRDNRDLLLDIVDSTKAAIQARYDETQSLYEANRVYEQGRQALIDAAMAAGATRAAAEALADQWLKMPPLVVTSVTTPGLDTAIAKTLRLLELRRLLGSNVAAANAYNNSGYTSGYRWGGITPVHARHGLLSQANVFNAGSRPLYAFAESGTEQEGFVPKRGDYGRSMSIMSTMAGWYGARVVPAGAAQTAGQTAQGSITAAEMGRAVKAALNGVVVVLDGRVVGRIEGGQANLYARGG